MREEIIFWQRAQHILDSHDYPTVAQCRQDIAPISQDYLDQGVLKKLKWDVNWYKINPDFYQKKTKTQMIEDEKEDDLMDLKA